MLIIAMFAIIIFAVLSGGFLLSENKQTRVQSVSPLSMVEIINNESELISFATSVGAGAHREGVTVRLSRDMNMYGLSWTPIGRPSQPFRGTFDAESFVIRNLHIGREQQNMLNENNFIGFFGGTNGAVIRNITLENISYNITGSQGSIGTAAANAGIGSSVTIGGLIAQSTNTIVENVVVSGGIMAFGGQGGLNHVTSSGTGRTGGAGGEVTVGGLIGAKTGGAVRRSTMFGEIYGHGGHGGGGGTGAASSAGGLGGNGGSVIFGGIAGRVGGGGIIEESYINAHVTAGNGRGGNGGNAGSTSGTAGGPGTAGNIVAGGLIGQVGPLAADSATVRHSFFAGHLEILTHANGLRHPGRIRGSGTSQTIGAMNASEGGRAVITGGGIVGLITGNEVSVANSYTAGRISTQHEYFTDGTTPNVRLAGVAGFVQGNNLSIQNTVSLTEFDAQIHLPSPMTPMPNPPVIVHSLTTNPFAVYQDATILNSSAFVSNGNQFFSLQGNSAEGQAARFPSVEPSVFVFNLNQPLLAQFVSGPFPAINWAQMTGVEGMANWLTGPSVPLGQNQWTSPEGITVTHLPVLVNRAWGGLRYDLEININNLTDLINFRNQVNGGRSFLGYTVKLNSDINIGTVTTWIPIGNNIARPFRGIFDGQGNVIRNLRMPAGTSSINAGFFGVTFGATIRNLKLEDPSINVSTTMNMTTTIIGVNTPSTGGIVGLSLGRLRIDNTHVYATPTFLGETFQITSNLTGTTSGTGLVLPLSVTRTGGLVGSAFGFNNHITRSSNNVPVQGASLRRGHGGQVGGLVGIAYRIVLEENMSLGTVQSTHTAQTPNDWARGGGSAVGGIVGNIQSFSIIRNNSSASSVRGMNTLGGIVGWMESWARHSIIERNLFTGEVVSTMTTSTASTTENLVMGGIVGSMGALDMTIRYNIMAGSRIQHIGTMSGSGTATIRVIGQISTLNPNARRVNPSPAAATWQSTINTAVNLVNRDAVIQASNNNFVGIPNAQLRDFGEGIGIDSTRPLISEGMFPGIFSNVSLGSLGVNWDTTNTWFLNEGEAPILRHFLNLDIPLGQAGTSLAPIIISNFSDLSTLRNRVNSGTNFANIHFRMTANIDLGGVNWIPIGIAGQSFNGIFDGGGFEIQGLYNTRTGTGNYRGLFGRTMGGAVIRNISIRNPNIAPRAGLNVGALIGHAQATTVDNVHIHGGQVSAVAGAANTANNVGGIVGQIGNGSSIRNSSTRGTIVKGEVNVGGIVGLSAGTVANTGITLANNFSTGHITGLNAVGGIAGVVRGTTLTTSYSTGAISATGGVVGGIIGQADTQSSRVEDTLSMGSITAFANINAVATSPMAGGIIGRVAINGTIVVNAIATGNIAAQNINTAANANSAVGGIIARVDIGTAVSTVRIDNSVVLSRRIFGYSVTPATRISSIFGNSDTNNGRPLGDGNRIRAGIELSISGREMADTLIYNSNFDMTTVAHYAGAGFGIGTPAATGTRWVLDTGANRGVPYIRALPIPVFTKGDASNPHLISNVDELRDLANKVNNGESRFLGQFIHLTQDLDVGEWGNPIGTSLAASFGGTFNGQGNTIKGLTTPFNRQNGTYGLFGYVAGGTIENLILTRVNIHITGLAANANNVGSLIGHADGGVRVSNVAVKDSIQVRSGGSGAITGAQNIGGLIGNITSRNNFVDRSFSTVNVNGGNNVGGLIGTMAGTTVTRSYASGNVGAHSNAAVGAAGGLVGFMEVFESSVENCFSTSNVTNIRNANNAFSFAGGLIGDVTAANSTIRNSYASGNVAATTLGTGTLATLHGSYSGGLVGRFNAGAGGLIEDSAAFNQILSSNTRNAANTADVNIVRLHAPIAGTTVAAATRSTVENVRFYDAVRSANNLTGNAASLTAIGGTPAFAVENRDEFFPNNFFDSLYIEDLGFSNAFWGIRRSQNNGSPYLRGLFIDISPLTRLINNTISLWHIRTNWTEQTYGALTDALRDAITVQNNTNRTLDDIDEAYLAILDAVNALRGDRSELGDVIMFVREFYFDWAHSFLTARDMPNSQQDIELLLNNLFLNWGNVSIAYNLANSINDNDSNRYTQVQINNAHSALLSAILPANLIINRAELTSLIALAEASNGIEFSETTIEVLETALLRARAAMMQNEIVVSGASRPISAGREVLAATITLREAISALEFDFTLSGFDTLIQVANDIAAIRANQTNRFGVPTGTTIGSPIFDTSAFLVNNVLPLATGFRETHEDSIEGSPVSAVLLKRAIMSELTTAIQAVQFNMTALNDLVVLLSVQRISYSPFQAALTEGFNMLAQNFLPNSEGRIQDTLNPLQSMSVNQFNARYESAIENIIEELFNCLIALRTESQHEADTYPDMYPAAPLPGHPDYFFNLRAGIMNANRVIGDNSRNAEELLNAINWLRHNKFSLSTFRQLLEQARFLINEEHFGGAYFAIGFGELLTAESLASIRYDSFVAPDAVFTPLQVRDAIEDLRDALDGLIINISRFHGTGGYFLRAQVYATPFGGFTIPTQIAMFNFLVNATNLGLANANQAHFNQLAAGVAANETVEEINRLSRTTYRDAFISQIQAFRIAFESRIYERENLAQAINNVESHKAYRNSNQPFRMGHAPFVFDDGAWYDYNSNRVNADGILVNADGSVREFLTYTSASWNDVRNEVNAARIVYFDIRATRTQIDEAAQNVLDAMNVLTTNTTRVEELLDIAENIIYNPGLFVPSTIESLKEIVDEISYELGNKRSFEEWQYDFERLQYAINNVQINVAALQALIDEAQALLPYYYRYTPLSWNTFTSMFTHVSATFNDIVDSSVGFDAATVTSLFNMLRASMNALRADVSLLVSRYEFARSLNPIFMTMASASALNDVLIEVAQVISNQNTSFTEVNEVLEELNYVLDNIAVNRTQLRLTIENAKIQLERFFTTTSINNLTAAIDAAELVYDELLAGYEGVQALMASNSAILNAVSSLIVDNTALSSVIFLARQYLYEIVEGRRTYEYYVGATLNALNEALNNGERLLNQSIITIDELTHAINSINTAFSGLRVDTTRLVVLLSQAQWFEDNMHLFVVFPPQFWTLQYETQNMIDGNPAIRDYLELYEDFRYFLGNLEFNSSALNALILQAQEILETRRDNYSGRSITNLEYWLEKGLDFSGGDPAEITSGLANAIINLVDVRELREAYSFARDFSNLHIGDFEADIGSYTIGTFNRLLRAINETNYELNYGELSATTVARLIAELDFERYLVYVGNLREALEIAIEYDDLDRFTADTIYVLIGAINHAQNILLSEYPSETAINQAIENLIQAIEGLEEIDYNYRLENILRDLEIYPRIAANYTVGSFIVFETYFNKAYALINNASGNYEFDEVYTGLRTAISNLIYVRDLIDLISEAEDIDLNNYTTATADAFSQVLSAAINVAENLNAMRTQIEQAIYDLIYARENLVERGPGYGEPDPVTYRERLEIFMRTVQNTNTANYTFDSAYVFENVLYAVQNLIYIGAEYDYEYEQIYNELHTAFNALVYIRDLNYLIYEANNIDYTRYTAASWSYFSSVVESITDRLSQTGVTRSEIQGMITQINIAREGLVVFTYTPGDTYEERLYNFVNALPVRDRNRFTETSFSNFEYYLNLAIDFNEGSYSGSRTAEELYHAVRIANEMLVYIGDLKDLVAYVADLNYQNYTVASFEKFYNELNNASNVLSNPNVLRSQVIEARISLQDAFDNLEEKNGNGNGNGNGNIYDDYYEERIYKFINNLPHRDKNRFTVNSFSVFEYYLNIANQFNSKIYSGVMTAQEIYSAVRLSENNLVYIGDLIDLILSIENIDYSRYTEISFSALVLELYNAVLILENPDAARGQIEDALIRIEYAFNALELRGYNPPPPPPPSDTNWGAILLWGGVGLGVLLLVLTLLIVLVLLSKKKKRLQAIEQRKQEESDLKAKAKQAISDAFTALSEAKTKMTFSKANPADQSARMDAMNALSKAKEGIVHATETVNKCLKVKSENAEKSRIQREGGEK